MTELGQGVPSKGTLPYCLRERAITLIVDIPLGSGKYLVQSVPGELR